MFKSFKYRIYPTDSQKELIHKHCGSARFIYNLALETKQMAYAGNKVNLTCFELIKQLPELKKELPWLKDCNSQSLQAPIRNLDNAFTKFFKGQADFPVFKKKSNKGSFNIPQNVILSDEVLVIPKFREGIKIKIHRDYYGKIKSATISYTSTGKYFVSILCDTEEEKPSKPKITEESSVGIDLGIKDFIVSSEAQVFDNPKYLRKSEKRLKFLQRKYSKHKGKRTKLKLAKLHEKVANQRKDFLHKVSKELIKNHDTICTETLQVRNMLKNHNLAKSISDAGWGMFMTMLEYKSEWYGKNLIKIGTFEPSSKTCGNCGLINKDLQLKDREWTCKSCSTILDRDLNAACNIKNFALRNYVSGTDTENQNELPTLVGVLTSETNTL
ncbi:MAG: transposase [Methylophaga sp.]|nr:transposase [Methylophaga sp.]